MERGLIFCFVALPPPYFYPQPDSFEGRSFLNSQAQPHGSVLMCAAGFVI